MATDPFGKSVFGGQVPGATTLGATTTAGKPPAYQYVNKGWSDPLAQEIAKKYLHDPTTRTSMWNPAGADDAYRRLKGLSDMYHVGGATAGAYQDPLDPKNWRQSGVYTGDQAQKMKEEYVNRGGLGTYEQLAFTNPKDIGAPYQTATGGPVGTDTWEGIQAKLGYKGATAPPTTPAGGVGSSFSLNPSVLSKMWR
jgi:hypothetical protein